MFPSSHCGTMSHVTRKFIPENDAYYAPAGMLYGRQAAESEMHLYANGIPSKCREKVETGLFTRAQWASIFLKATKKAGHKGLVEANLEEKRSLTQRGRILDTGEDMSLSSGASRFSEDKLVQKFELTYPWEVVDKGEE